MGALFVFVGLLLLALAFITKRRAQRWQQTARFTTGQILTFTRERDRDSDGQTSVDCFCDIQYTVDRSAYQFKSKVPNAPAKFAVGNPVQVFYNSVNPQDARLSAGNTGVILLFIIAGSLFVLVGAVFLAAT